MKQLIIFSFFLLTTAKLFSQQGAGKHEPFIVSGRLINFSSKNIVISYENHTADTIPVDAEGRFYFKSDTITRPAKVLFSKRAAFFVTDLFIAPGYNLFITANCKDIKTCNLTKKITGRGAAINTYIFIRDSVYNSRPLIEYQNLKHDSLLLFANANKRTTDSIMNIVAKRSVSTDKYETFFKKLIKYDNSFRRLFYLVNPAITEKQLSAEQCIAFVKHNFDPQVYANLFNPDYVISSIYRSLMQTDYVMYLTAIDCKRDPAQCSTQVNYRIKNLEKIDATYKGEIKQIALDNELFNAVNNVRSFDELGLYESALSKYGSMLSDKKEKIVLDKLFSDRSARLINTKIGKPAPVFSAEDSLGRTLSLSAFKGKVVLVDLWASWCGPCREETPFIKEIYEKYKNEKDMAIISIAVQDKPKEWRMAMRQDKPTWLQLFDTNGSVKNGYVANSIPKFVVINKEGNIVSFDAPGPHTGIELTSLLDKEIAK